MESNKILYSKGKNDECLTPSYAVLPLIKYIPKNYTIWCPFDKDDSEYVIQLRKNGFKVINSHIEQGEDFYKYEPTENWDMIISNPPFTNKSKIFARALSFGKPFMLLSTATWRNDGSFAKLWKDNGLQIMTFNKRIKFNVNGVINNKITFMSLYLCKDILPKDIVFEEIIN